jgi:hypothetical protein
MEDDIFLEVFGGFGGVEGFALLCSFSSRKVCMYFYFFIFFRTLCFRVLEVGGALWSIVESCSRFC